MRRLTVARPGRLVAGMCLAGVLLTALTAWAAARADRNTEERLLQTQTRQAATVLATAISVIEQPLSAVLAAQALLPVEAAAQAFTQLFASDVGDDRPFVSASMWRSGDADVTRLQTLGADPAMDPAGSEVQSLLQRALTGSTTVVQRVEAADRIVIVYALADADTGLVIYAERLVPENRRSPVDRDSAYADVHYAIYLGPGTETENMTTTDVDPADLPLTGLTAEESVPFGDTVLTLVTARRDHLGSSLSERLPWFLLLTGLVLTAAVGVAARQLLQSRQQAMSATETITSLYRRMDSMYAEEREVSVRLQRALLPRVIPDIPGIEVAAEYVAGGHGIDIGGDWYSAIALDDETFGFVVGDVSGHGIDAVAEMARARFTLRAYLFDGAAPEAALEKCARQFDITTDGHLVTALVGVGNRRTGEVTVASAGHPPPLLLTEGTAAFVRVSPGLPLGAGLSSYRSTTFAMPPGSTLIAFTDGLVERRGEAIEAGMQRLLETVGPLRGLPLTEVIVAALTAHEETEVADDVAVLALRRDDPGTMRLRADARAPAAARAFVAGSAAETDVPDDVREDVVLMASELVTNAVKSGATQIVVTLDLSPERLVLVVDDDGSGWPTMLETDDEATGGRGLAIVDHLADEWEVVPRPEGKRVRAVRALVAGTTD